MFSAVSVVSSHFIVGGALKYSSGLIGRRTTCVVLRKGQAKTRDRGALAFSFENRPVNNKEQDLRNYLGPQVTYEQGLTRLL
jgi:hypothetical protein